MAIAATNIGITSDAVDATSFTCSVSAPGAGCYIIIDVASRNASTVPNLPTLSGGSLSYSAEIDITDAGVRRLSRGYAQCVSDPGAFTLTADFAGQTQTSCFIHVTKVTGGSTSDPIVQSVTATETSTVCTATLAAFADANNRPLFFCTQYGSGGPAMTAEGTELAENVQLENIVAHSNVGTTADTTPSATSTGSAAFVVIASELAIVSAAGADVLDPMGMSGFFGG